MKRSIWFTGTTFSFKKLRSGYNCPGSCSLSHTSTKNISIILLRKEDGIIKRAAHKNVCSPKNQLRCQISLLYSLIVLSDEKKPALAMFVSIIFFHLFLSS